MSPSCPICRGDMVLKTGRHGQFWGCSQFPSCKGNVDFRPDDSVRANFGPSTEQEQPPLPELQPVWERWSV